MLDVACSVENGHARIRLGGDLAIETVDRLGVALAPIRGRCRTADVNLAQLQFVDSSGIGALLTLGSDLQAAGGGLTLSEIPALIREVLETLGLLDLLGGGLSHSEEVNLRGTPASGSSDSQP